MDINYKCESCEVIGGLDEYYEHLDCPECGGIMYPLSSIEELTSEDFVPPNLDDDATIAIPRDFIPKEEKGTGIKIAAAVDIGFGGMLSASSATGKYSPASSGSTTPPSMTASATGHHVAQPIPSSIPTAPPAQQVTAATAAPPLSTGYHVAQPASPSSIPMAPPAPQQPVQQQAPPPKKASQPIASQTKTGGKKAFTLSKGKSSASKEREPGGKKKFKSQSAESTSVAATRSPGKTGMMLKTNKGKNFKKKGAPSPQQSQSSIGKGTAKFQTLQAGDDASEAAQTQSAMPLHNSFQEPSVTSRELELAAMDQAAKFAALQAELDVERDARLDAEQRAAEDKARIAEINNKKAAERAAVEAAEKAKKKIAKERENAEKVAETKIRKEKNGGNTKEKSAKKSPGNEKRGEKKGSSVANAQPDDNRNKDRRTSDSNKEDDKNDLAKKKKVPGKMPKGKGMSPLPGKKGGLPPPKGMGGVGGKKKGTSEKSGMSNTQGVKQKTGQSAATKTGIPRSTKTDDLDELSRTAAALGMTNTGLIRLNNKKKTQVYIILGIIVAVICLIIIIGMYWVRVGFAPKKHKTPKVTTRVNMNTIKKRSSSSSSASTSIRPVAVSEHSSLSKKYLNTRRKAKRMQSKTASDIDAKIQLWQGFIDENKAKHPDDPKLKKAKDVIKNLKDLKSLYEM